MPDKDKISLNLSDSVRPGGFFRQEALSGKDEDATYVDSAGQPIPDDEVEKYKSLNEERSKALEEQSRQANPGIAAGTPAATAAVPSRAGAVPQPRQEPVVDTRSAEDAERSLVDRINE